MPFLMRPLVRRRLTPAERSLAHEMFGTGLDVQRVRLFALPVWRRAFVAGPGLIIWPGATAWTDFGEAPLADQAVLIHELTHVWQAQAGISLLRGKLKAGDSAASYAYDLTGGTAFAALNIEQQAMVVEHAFLSSRGVGVPHPPELYAEASIGWRQT